MITKLKYDNKTIKIIIKTDDEKVYEYDLEEKINLTNLVLCMSDLTETIEPSPENFETFNETYTCESKNLLKVTEYIYRIIEAFNLSFNEVYSDNTQKTDA